MLIYLVMSRGIERSQSERLTSSRAEYNAHLSPAIHSGFARDTLIPLIQKLPFPESTEQKPVLDIQSLGMWTWHLLGLSKGEVKSRAIKDGVLEEANPHQLNNYSYGDRHFTMQFAGAIARDVGRLLIASDLTTQPVSLMDGSAMFKTGWFGSLLNSMAIARQGLFQFATNTTNVNYGFKYKFAEAIKFDDNPYDLINEEQSGKKIVQLTKDAKAATHATLDNIGTNGCPVARTSFLANADQAEFLSAHGHIGPDAVSGFEIIKNGSKSDDTRIIQQGPYTAIDDVVFAWSEYVDAYALRLLDRGITEGVLPTETSNILLV